MFSNVNNKFEDKTVAERTKKEKPSSLSKKVLKTQLRNEWENVVLEERLKNLDKQQFQRNYVHIKTVQKLQDMITDIKKVRTRLSVGPERRQFLLKNGFSIKEKDFEIDYYLQLMDGVIHETRNDYCASINAMNFSNASNHRPHTPLIRLSDFIREKENAKKHKKVEIDLNENKDVYQQQQQQRQQQYQETVLPVKRIAFLKTRVIEPPINGREMCKVHMEQNKLNNDKNKNKCKENMADDEEIVEMYRQKITGKLNMSSAYLVRKHTNYQQRKRPSTTPSVVKRNRHRMLSARPSTPNSNPSLKITDTSGDSDVKNSMNTRLDRVDGNIKTRLERLGSKTLKQQEPTGRHSDGNEETHLKAPSSVKRRSNSAKSIKQNERITELQITIQGRCRKVFVPKF